MVVDNSFNIYILESKFQKLDLYLYTIFWIFIHFQFYCHLSHYCAQFSSGNKTYKIYGYFTYPSKFLFRCTI